MANNSSSSASSTSLYITPTNSPTQSRYSLDSTSMDVSFSFDHLEPRCSSSFQEVHGLIQPPEPSPASTSSTIRAQQSSAPPITSRQFQTNRNFVVPFPVSVANYGLDYQQSNDKSEKIQMAMKYLKDLNDEQVQLLSFQQQILGLEQQMKMMSLHCKQMNQSITFKVNSLYSLLEDLIPSKVDVQTQTVFPSEEQRGNQNAATLFKKTQQPTPSSRQKHSSTPILNQMPNPLLATPFCLNKKISNTFVKEDKMSGKVNVPEGVKKKLTRLPAMVKGYLTRRLLKTETVQEIVKVIKDTMVFLHTMANLENVTEQDVQLHERAMEQLEQNYQKFYDIFMNYSKSQQMSLISKSRTLALERQFKRVSSAKSSSQASSRKQLKTNVSSATKKVMQRKLNTSVNTPSFIVANQRTSNVANISSSSKTSRQSIASHSSHLNSSLYQIQESTSERKSRVQKVSKSTGIRRSPKRKLFAS